MFYLIVILDSVTKAVSDLDRKKIDQLEGQLLNTQHENSKLKVSRCILIKHLNSLQLHFIKYCK